MPQSARILTTACPNPAVSLEDCQREYGRITRSAFPQRFRYTGPLYPPSCTVQRPGFSIGSISGYLSGFTNAACAPSWHQMARPSVERRNSQESQPAQHRVHLQVQLRWAGHVTKMEDVRMPKAVLFSKFQKGKRDRGASRKRYKDQLERQIAQAGISHRSWRQVSHRDSLRSL